MKINLPLPATVVVSVYSFSGEKPQLFQFSSIQNTPPLPSSWTNSVSVLKLLCE